jgi:hypothetical protein
MPDLDDIWGLAIGFLLSQLIAFALLGLFGFTSFSEVASFVRNRFS